MGTKITVNGVTYDSVETMPEEIRKLYDETMKKLPDPADRAGDGTPDVIVGEGLPGQTGLVVQHSFVVNGKRYDREEDMPPDARKTYEMAKSMLSADGPGLTKDEVRVSFQLTGPGIHFQKKFGGPSSSPPTVATPKPIEPGSVGGGIRFVLIVAAFVAGGFVVWLLMRGH
jgi:hypothetical protein